MSQENAKQGGSALPPDAAILDSMGLALMAVDRRCRILRFNLTAERLTGFRREEVVGRNCAEVLKGSVCQAGCPVREALRTGNSCSYPTVVLQRSDGLPRTVEMTASPLEDGSSRPVGAVGVLRDLADDPGQVRLYGSRMFVSRTPEMRRIFDALPRLASSQAPLLIIGGRGSGRSSLAETVHNLGCRNGPRPLVTVQCPDARAREALGRALSGPAEGGTLLLADVCGAPVELQRQLLAWLEEGGEGLPFRVVSTATRRLDQCLQRGIFRRDLFYRLDVLHVQMPGLRERAEDIPLLVAQFIEDLNNRRQREVVGLTPQAMARLIEADLPDNVRQLRMAVDYAHGRCKGRLIELGDLPDLSLPLKTRRAQLELETIKAALQQAGGNITKAAEALQVHRTTLWRKIKRYKLKS